MPETHDNEIGADELPVGAAMAAWFAMWLGDVLWRHAPGFVAGCYFAVGAAWVWSFWL
jgi:hypothetical protein